MQVDQIVIRSSAVSDNMYTSIDKATHRLQQQLLRYKDRIQKYHARGASAIDVEVKVFEAARDAMLDEVNAEIEEKNNEELVSSYKLHQIVSQEKMRLKSLTDDEAFMKMELSRDPFMVYHSDDKKLRIIYRREDGNFGIIEPESK